MNILAINCFTLNHMYFCCIWCQFSPLVYIPLQELYTKSVLKNTRNCSFTLPGVKLPEYGVPMEAITLHQISAKKPC